MKKIILVILISITVPLAKTMTLKGEFKVVDDESFIGKFLNKENQCVLSLWFNSPPRGGGRLNIQCEKEYNGVISLECFEYIASFKKIKDDVGYINSSKIPDWVSCKEFKVIFRD